LQRKAACADEQLSRFLSANSFLVRCRFRYRKVFLGWRQWVRAGKREAARESLLSDSYFSYPVLLQGMLDVRLELLSLSRRQLMWSFDGETLSLEAFTAANVRPGRAVLMESDAAH
jgi:hypothetical protein